MMRIAVWLYSLLFPLLALAEDQTSPPPNNATIDTASNAISQPVTGSNILELTIGLVFIIILIFVIAWFVKRFSVFHPVASDQLKVVAGIHLGQREKIMLVQVGEQQILVGLTATDIRTLHVLETPLEVHEHKSMKNSEFARKLAGVMQNMKGRK